MWMMTPSNDKARPSTRRTELQPILCKQTKYQFWHKGHHHLLAVVNIPIPTLEGELQRHEWEEDDDQLTLLCVDKAPLPFVIGPAINYIDRSLVGGWWAGVEKEDNKYPPGSPPQKTSNMAPVFVQED